MELLFSILIILYEQVNNKTVYPAADVLNWQNNKIEYEVSVDMRKE